MMHVPRPQLIAALAGAAVPLSAMAAFAARRLFRSTPAPSTAVTAWTVADVCQWLRHIGAQKATINTFKMQGIDGSTLCAVTQADLQAIGVCARDARLVMAAREDVMQSGPFALTPAPVMPPLYLNMGALSQPNHSPQSHGVRLFIRNAEDLLATASVAPADVEEENAHRAQTARQLYALLDVFRELSKADQTTAMDPLGRQLLAIATMPTPRARVSVVPTERGSVSMAPPTPVRTPAQRESSASSHAVPPQSYPSQAAAQVEMQKRENINAKLAPLDAMVDNFLRLLTSDEFERVPAKEFGVIADRVEAQIDRIQGVAAQLPTPEARALQQKCAAVLQLIAEAKERAATPSAAAQSDPTPAETDEALERKNEENTNALMQRLEAVFRVANDRATLSLPAAQLAELVQRLKGEVAGVQAGAAELCGDRRDVLLQVSSKVAALLEELSNLSRREGDTTAAAASDESERQMAAQVGVVSSAMREILDVLQSPQFNNAPPAVRSQLSARLLQRVAQLSAACEELPEVDRAALLEVMGGVTKLLQSQPEAPAAQSRQTTVPPHEPAMDAETPVEMPLDIIAEQLEKILEFLNSQSFRQAPDTVKAPTKTVLLPLLEVLRSLQSDSFNNAPEEAKLKYVAQVSRQLNAVMTAAESVPPPFRQPVDGFIRGTVGLLQAEASDLSSRHATRTAPAPPTDNAQEAALDGIIDQASSLFSFVTSDTFEQADPAARRRIALDAIPRVRALQAAARGVVGPDHLVFSEVLVPLEELLTEVAQAGEAQAEREAAQEDEEEQGEADEDSHEEEEEDARETTQAFQDIVEALEDVDEVLDSPKLQQTSEERRQHLVRTIITQLQRITAVFPTLPPSERQKAQDRVAPIHAKLVALVRSAASQDEEAAAAADDSRREREAPAAPQPDQAGMSPNAIIQELKQVMTVLQDERLVTGDPGTAATRVAVLKGAGERLELLLKESEDKPEAFRATVVPVVTRMREQIAQILQLVLAMSANGAPTTEETNARGVPPAAEGESAEEDEQRGSIYGRIAEITDELRRGRAQGMTMGPAELEPLMNLWRTVAAIDTPSADEQRIGNEFLEELKQQIEPTAPDTASRAVPAVVSVEEGEEEAAADDGDDVDASLQTFMRTFAYIRKTLTSRRLNSPSDLIPFMAMAERTLTKAEEFGVDWRTNEEAANLVRRTLGTIQELQAALVQRAASASPDKSRAAPPSAEQPLMPRMRAQLAAALESIRATPPTSAEELEVYLGVLQSVEDSEEDLTMQDLLSFKALQEAILEAGRNLGDGANDEEEEMEEDEEDAGEGEEAEGQQPPSPGAAEGLAAEILLRISDQLREGLLPEEILAQYEAIIDAVSQNMSNPAYTEAMEAIKEQIRLQRYQQSNQEEEEPQEDASAGQDVDVDGPESAPRGAPVTVQRQESDAIVREVAAPVGANTQVPSEGVFQERDDEEDDNRAEL